MVRRFKGQLIDPTGKHVIDYVDAAELEAVSKKMYKLPVIFLPSPSKKKT